MTTTPVSSSSSQSVSRTVVLIGLLAYAQFAMLESIQFITTKTNVFILINHSK